jgi:DNA-binding NarL/FixJ family response regulator
MSLLRDWVGCAGFLAKKMNTDGKDICMTIRAVLADDHQIMREGLASLLERETDIQIVGEAADGAEAVRLSISASPDLLITDLSMPRLNGVEAIRRIKTRVPETKVLCLSIHKDPERVAAVIDAGANGYLLKDCAYEELVRAVRVVVEGEVYLSPEIASIVVNGFRDKRSDCQVSVSSRLTTREREVVQLLAEGRPTKEIANRMNVSIKTVGAHREHVMAKLQIHSVAELTHFAIREGISSIETHFGKA